MDREAIINELMDTIGGYLHEQQLTLVDLVYRREGRGMVLRILVDRPEGGINLGECARLNSGISAMLDEKGIPDERYILEVSSPGLDRPLKTKNDFLRCINRRVRIFLSEEIENAWEVDGRITKADEMYVYVETEKGEIFIPLPKINRAKQIIAS